MLDKLAPAAEETAQETAEDWLNAFAAALAQRDPRTLADLFVPDSHWPNIPGLIQAAIALQIDAIERGRLAKAIH